MSTSNVIARVPFMGATTTRMPFDKIDRLNSIFSFYHTIIFLSSHKNYW